MENLYALLGAGAGSSKVLKVEPGASTPSYSTGCSNSSAGVGASTTPHPHPVRTSSDEGTISSHEQQAHTPRPLPSPQGREGKPLSPIDRQHAVLYRRSRSLSGQNDLYIASSDRMLFIHYVHIDEHFQTEKKEKYLSWIRSIDWLFFAAWLPLASPLHIIDHFDSLYPRK